MANISLISSACLVIAVLGFAEVSHSAGYKFIEIVDNNDAAPIGAGFKIFGYSLSGDTVAFNGAFASQSRSGTFTTRGGPLTTIAKSDDQAPFGTFIADQFAIKWASISDGVTAFTGAYGTGARRLGEGVFTGSGGTLTVIAKTGDSAPIGTFTNFHGPPAASAGAVAFVAEYTDGKGIFVGVGGALTTIARSGDVSAMGAIVDFTSTAIANDLVVFQARSATASGIFASSGGVLTPLITTNDATPFGPFSSLSSAVVCGNTVGFVGNYSGGRGVFTTNGTIVTSIAKSGDVAPVGTFGSLFSTVSVSQGLVAFIAEDFDGTGIFLEHGGDISALIRTGDPLFGSSVSQVFWTHEVWMTRGAASLPLPIGLPMGGWELHWPCRSRRQPTRTGLDGHASQLRYLGLDGECPGWRFRRAIRQSG